MKPMKSSAKAKRGQKMNGPKDYIPDWTEQDGTYNEQVDPDEYSDFDELRDRERGFDG